MRKFGMLVVGGAIVTMMSVAWVEGQPGGGKGLFGGFGGPKTPLTLLNDKDVKKELDVTDAQLEKLSPEVMVAISRVLNDKQFKRFKQIDLQQRGNTAFKDEAVQKELKMTADQKKSIVSVIDDSEKEITDLRAATFKGGKGGKGGGDFKGFTEKQDNLRKEAKEKIYGVLTKDQRLAYRGMIGDEFKFTAPGKKDTTKKDQD